MKRNKMVHKNSLAVKKKKKKKIEQGTFVSTMGLILHSTLNSTGKFVVCIIKSFEL